MFWQGNLIKFVDVLSTVRSKLNPAGMPILFAKGMLLLVVTSPSLSTWPFSWKISSPIFCFTARVTGIPISSKKVWLVFLFKTSMVCQLSNPMTSRPSSPSAHCQCKKQY